MQAVLNPDEWRQRRIGSMQAAYDEVIGRKNACIFVDAGAITSLRELVGRTNLVTERLLKAMPPGRRVPERLRQTVLSLIAKGAVSPGAWFLPIPTDPSDLPIVPRFGAVGRFMRDVGQSARGRDGANGLGLCVVGLHHSLDPFEKLCQTTGLAQYRLLPDVSPGGSATRTFAFFHEAKHAEHFLAPEIRRHRNLPPFQLSLSSQDEWRQREAEIGADLTATAAAVAMTGRPIAAAMADMRALSFAIWARRGEPSLRHWTTWALDAWSDEIDRAAVQGGAPFSPLDAGLEFDREAHVHAASEKDREMAAICAEFRRLAWECRDQTFMEFLDTAAASPLTSRYARRSIEAAERLLDIQWCDDFEAARFEQEETTLASGRMHWSLRCNGMQIMSMGGTPGRRETARSVMGLISTRNVGSLLAMAERAQIVGVKTASLLSNQSEQQLQTMLDAFGTETQAAFMDASDRIRTAVEDLLPEPESKPEHEIVEAPSGM